ncbi:hypothetical protein M9Y10_036957 [Tritrichomonas musculus]|uniref:Uncharacterized protein n=1 Tax=Tritrichomonas musculus TaxID=1915356 RepID=A0ABR2GU95_9EUKA
MKINSRQLNSCICKCGSVSCRNIHIHSFKDQIPEDNDQFVYSVLHHKSLRVLNSKSVVVDRCCDNCLHFHCSKCHEQFTILKSQSSKYRFIFGFSSDRLAHLEPTNCNEVVTIPDFPIALKSFVYLAEQKINDNNINDINKSCHLKNNSFKNYENDEDDEILSFDSDEDIMFGRDQTEMIIGKYNEASISSFKEQSSLLNYSFKNYENDEDDEIFSFDSNENCLFGKDQTVLIIGKYNEASVSSFKQSYLSL